MLIICNSLKQLYNCNNVNKLFHQNSLLTAMLNERKKYNYMGGSYRKSQPLSAVKNQNDYYDRPHHAQTSQKIIELEEANKKLLDETTKQYKKFEEDVVRVEGILEKKQAMVSELEKQNCELTKDKAMLIEALNMKEEIIQELQKKFKQLLNDKEAYQSRSPLKKPQLVQNQGQTDRTGCEDAGSQTEQLDGQPECRLKYQRVVKKLKAVEQEADQYKQELYEANLQLGLIQQQFSAFKLLHEIDAAKNL